MSESTVAAPIHRADVVGSLLRPTELVEARQRRRSGALSDEEYRESRIARSTRRFGFRRRPAWMSRLMESSVGISSSISSCPGPRGFPCSTSWVDRSFPQQRG